MRKLWLELAVATVGALVGLALFANIVNVVVGGPVSIREERYRPTPPRESRERAGAPSWMSAAYGNCVLSHRSYSGRIDLRLTFACEDGWRGKLTCDKQRLALAAMLGEFQRRRSTAHTISVETASGIVIGQINRGALGGLSYHCGDG